LRRTSSCRSWRADGAICLCGGGAFAGLLAQSGLVDRLRLKIAPALLGAGVPLFEGVETPLRLRRTAATAHASGVVFTGHEQAIAG
jgi:dihydrofolate reductase